MFSAYYLPKQLFGAVLLCTLGVHTKLIDSSNALLSPFLKIFMSSSWNLVIGISVIDVVFEGPPDPKLIHSFALAPQHEPLATGWSAR